MNLVVRAKKKADGEWVRGYIWRGNSVAVIIPYNIGVDIDVKKNSLSAWAVEVDPATISRLVCREDSKGHSLVEHQIIEAHTCDGKIRGVLMYNERRGAWEVQVPAKDTDDMRIYDLISCVQIVALGNIFDNANLLDEVGDEEEGNEAGEQQARNEKDDERDSMKHEEPYVAPCGKVWSKEEYARLGEDIGKFMRTPGCQIIVIERRRK